MEQFEIYKTLGISEEVYKAGERLEQELMPRFLEFDKTAEFNQLKVLAAMQKNRVSAECFQYATGYGFLRVLCCSFDRFRTKHSLSLVSYSPEASVLPVSGFKAAASESCVPVSSPSAASGSEAV